LRTGSNPRIAALGIRVQEGLMDDPLIERAEVVALLLAKLDARASRG